MNWASEELSQQSIDASCDVAANSLVRLKALIFDLDGTLYGQGPLRRAMAIRLARAYALQPAKGLRVVRALRAYRRALEDMRNEVNWAGSPDQALVDRASDRSGLQKEFICCCIGRWMRQEPLAVLVRCLRNDLIPVLMLAKARGLRMGLFSDYPALRKLEALGLRTFFEVVVSAEDREVQRFKPDPRGLRVVLSRLSVSREEALYIGDRAEVDAEAARRCGVQCLLLNSSRRQQAKWGCLPLSSFSQLKNCLQQTV